MKPLNLDNRPCSPVSSNCIVWQGPDISCINICNGDTISDVVAALATELCTLLDQTNVNNYDLTCLGETCGPKDFQALIQLLINKICELNGITPDTVRTTGGCPDCIVTVASCFQEGNQTTMQLLDYVNMIAEKVCALIDEINNLQIQINGLDIRVTVLENTPPPVFTLPSILVDCTLSASILGGNSYTIDLVLAALINDDTYGYCSLLGSTGLPADLFSAVSSQCITSTTPTLSNPPVPFGTEYLGSWVDTPTSVANTITNLWLVICDMYDYVSTVTIAVEDTNSIDLTLTAGVITANIVDTGWVNLNGFEFYAPGIGRPQCRRIGNVVHFRGTAVIPLETTPGGTPLVFNSSAGSNTYIAQTTVAPSETGAGSVFLDINGAVYFNANASVIPSSVVSPTASGGFYFDNTYTKQFTLGARGIIIENSANPTDLISTILSTVGTLIITKEGKLGITIVRDSEESNVSLYQSDYSFHTSHLNYIVSHVVENEYVPNFQAIQTTVHSSAASGVQTVDINHTQSASWLTIARSTPATPKTYQYRFSFNGNDINSLGGVAYNLDGLTAYIDPCTTDIKKYVCE
jgi:hypothetical protein